MKKKDLHITIWWLLLPLLIYYLVNNGIVMAGAWLLQKFMQAQQADSSHILQYLQTVVKMTGMFLAGVAVVPFYLCESAKEKEENLANSFDLFLSGSYNIQYSCRSFFGICFYYG